MAQYHVGCSAITGTIYAGTINKKGDQWVNKNDVTDEAQCAVRDCLEYHANQNHSHTFGYSWTKKDGTIVKLLVEIVPPKENVDGSDNS